MSFSKPGYYSKEKLTPQPLLAKILDGKGYRRHWVAAKVGYRANYLSEIINGHRPLTDKFKKRVAEFLDLPIEAIFPK